MAAVAPSSSYLICSTPRSGTTLLCEALRNTGLAGRPEEYFQQLPETGRPRTPHDYFADAEDPELLELVCWCAAPADLDPLLEPSRFDTWRKYFDWALEQGTTANGVFGAKIMWAYLPGLVTHLAAERPEPADTDPGADLLEHVLPSLRYVFVTRADRAAQAVSLWRALQTWRWRHEAKAGQARKQDEQLRYSFEAIDHLAHLLADEDAAWRDWFERNAIQPLTVLYEDLAGAYEETALAIMRHVGVRPPAGLHFGKPRLTRQADELSRDWVGRYTAEVEARVRL
jgi:trehalose 2-sulfotransferase